MPQLETENAMHAPVSLSFEYVPAPQAVHFESIVGLPGVYPNPGEHLLLLWAWHDALPVGAPPHQTPSDPLQLLEDCWAHPPLSLPRAHVSTSVDFSPPVL